MTTLREDTCVARMTAPGRAALATIALDGPDAISIAARLFHSAQRISDFGRTRAHYYGRFGDSITDDVVLAVVEPGQTVEVHCHGGPVMVQQLIADIQTAGARLVAWHDLLLRQGQHPTRIEAAHTLSRARAPKAAAILLDQLNGALETAFSQIESRRNRSLANSLLRWTSLGLRLVEGWSIVLLGRPNVGKSSLLNAILGFERVIVSPQPGTTRDLIEVEATLDGWPVRITDGAGLRNSDDPVERIGVQRVRSWAQSADCRLFLQDISSHRHHEDIELIPEFDPHYIVGTKADLASPWTEHEMSELDYTVSVVDGRGIGQLLEAIVARLVPDAPPAGQPIPFTDRQVDWLTRWTNAQG